MKKLINYITKSFIVLVTIIIPLNSNANHLVGGTMSYECLGGNNYVIKLTIYRDCSSSTQFDINAPIGIFNQNGGMEFLHLVPSSIITTVPIILNNPCLVSPPNVCVEKCVYELTTTLPPIAGGYNIVYQRCCRNINAVNIITPGDMGSTYTIHIPETNLAVCNNSPTFNNPPPTIMCTGYKFEYDLSATDIDGDSLYYTFGNPINGGSSLDPAPNPPSSAPFNNIPWSTGYNTNFQIDANPAFTIDPQTGFLSGTPTTSGFYTFCIVIKEYRNGVFINEINRDFLLTITNCATNTVADFSDQFNNAGQTKFCEGTMVNFTDNSLNTSEYYWDFGVPNTTSDTSNLQNPIFTYPDTGTYNVMLIANPNYFCADTIFYNFVISPSINPSFAIPNPQCLPGNLFNLQALGTFDNNPIIDWDFGNLATPNNASGSSAQVSFNDIGTHTINLVIQSFGCIDSFSTTIDIYPFPTADFPAQTIFCDGLDIQFNNNSTDATGYFWDFGDTNSSNLITPLHNYADSGTYNVMMVANQQNICYDTTYKTFNVYPPLVGTFTHPNDQCLPSNNFKLEATGNFNSGAIINWDFGSLGNPQTATTQQTQVSFLDTGFYPVHLTIQNYGCNSSYYDTINVFPIPKPSFTLEADTGCQPFRVTFYDSSFAWTPLSYLWDFGDGTTSTQQIPTHTYLNPGVFDINLTVSTDSGCIDTNTLSLPKLITVNPKPNANFMLNPTETYFINHEIIADDLSDELYQEFHLGDGYITPDRHIEYSYADTGHYEFTQYVTNEFNCLDTASYPIWIKPDFLFYVPNAFTPDGNDLNEIFLPQIEGILEYNLYLFNRWGELYFKSDNLSYGWDGTYKNKPAPIGVYNWRIEVKTIDHKIHKRVGYLNLIR